MRTEKTKRTIKEIRFIPRGPSKYSGNERRKDHTTLIHCEISEHYRERDHFDSEAFQKGRGGKIQKIKKKNSIRFSVVILEDGAMLSKF